MKKVLTIWKKEARGYANSPLAYMAVAVAFVATSAWFSILLYVSREASMRGLVVFLSFILLAITPILTMRSLAEENSRGTMELLLTSPVTESDIVLGKFLGTLTLYGAFFALTLIFPIVLFSVGTPEKGPMFTQYLGLVLSSAAFIAVGIFASSVTASQMFAAILSYILLLGLWIVGLVAGMLPDAAGQVAKALALSGHLDNFAKGIVDSVDLYYYLAFTAVFLLLSWRFVEARRWAA